MQQPRPPLGAGGCVLMAYGFEPEKLSCETIFNLLCPFGNVLKVIQNLKIQPYKVRYVELAWSHNVHVTISRLHVNFKIRSSVLTAPSLKLCHIELFLTA